MVPIHIQSASSKVRKVTDLIYCNFYKHSSPQTSGRSAPGHSPGHKNEFNYIHKPIRIFIIDYNFVNSISLLLSRSEAANTQYILDFV